MRRLLLIGLMVVLSGLVLASAAALDVDAGALQVFGFSVDVEVPTSVTAPSSTSVVDPTPIYTTTTTAYPTDDPTTIVEAETP
ncbi:MAG TPA: hypothetical protein VI980_09280 [Acidimicrobiia bacterium]|nr:hypothetical protein [Acidimicrobiia bacterium]